MSDTGQFYAGLAPLYHLIYSDWDQSMERQATVLDSVIHEAWGKVSTVLDVSCGIGTQAIGLAKLGYIVTSYIALCGSHTCQISQRTGPSCRMPYGLICCLDRSSAS